MFLLFFRYNLHTMPEELCLISTVSVKFTQNILVNPLFHFVYRVKLLNIKRTPGSESHFNLASFLGCVEMKNEYC